ncbi:MAG: DUF1778 domain-containing protein [Bacteroidetes bacterium]|nr:DUF1778 domain-containing protein [Bacteroidota bacterium]
MEELITQFDDKHEKPAKDRRIDLRLEAKQKAMLEAAATATGQSLMSFIVSNSLKVAQSVLREYRATELSLADSEKFMRMLENPAKPNKALLKAARRHRQKIKSSHGL